MVSDAISGKKARTNSRRSRIRARFGEASTSRENFHGGRSGPKSMASCSSGRARRRRRAMPGLLLAQHPRVPQQGRCLSEHRLALWTTVGTPGTLAPRMSLERPDLSAVVPAFDERENLPVLVEELRAALDATGRRWEIVLVDDGSRDGSDEWMLQAAALDPRIVPVLLEKNVGQSGALAVGLQRARGAIVVTLDADLQNDPADLDRLLRALEHADVVSGVRQHRQDSWVRLVSSRIANG